MTRSLFLLIFGLLLAWVLLDELFGKHRISNLVKSYVPESPNNPISKTIDAVQKYVPNLNTPTDPAATTVNTATSTANAFLQDMKSHWNDLMKLITGGYKN